MNLNNYKLHALGDYVCYITVFGTSDSYSTQTGELEHRRVKRFYARINKNTAVRQMTILERREQALLRIARKLGQILPESPPQPQKKGKRKPKKSRLLHIDFHTNIPQFLRENDGDPSIEDFLPKLKDHLLGRLAHPN
ncbi:hypothetical protein B0H13DRAFT_2356314 [Mycena leptocephala]|nr:hypothetical protein B0H13DRAFT_2356314 [Mycena leptocephala]